jgi:hypothetical protein
MRRFESLIALAGLLILAAPAAAQGARDTTDALVPGRRAYSFTARTLERGGDAGFGVWRVVSPDRSRGLLINISGHVNHGDMEEGPFATGTNSGAGVSIDLGPRARRYVARSGPLAPFVESGMDVGVAYDWSQGNGGGSSQSSHSWSPRLGGMLAAGAEWFPLRRLSVAGETGFQANVSYLRRSVSGGASAGHDSEWASSLNTFISALTLQLYF